MVAARGKGVHVCERGEELLFVLIPDEERDGRKQINEPIVFFLVSHSISQSFQSEINHCSHWVTQKMLFKVQVAEFKLGSTLSRA